MRTVLMTQPSLYQPVVERACSTEPGGEEIRKAAYEDLVNAINGRKLPLHDLAVLLAVPLTSPEKEARENGTRLLGEVVSRCRPVLGDGELHTLAEFLAARLKDWPCVGAAATACRALLQPLPYGGGATSCGPDGDSAGGGGRGGRLRDESALMVLQATVEMLRGAQSFRQEERCALLRLLLAAARGWGGLAGSPGVELLDGFLGAVDGEKDPRCLMLAFEAVQTLCQMYHEPRVDPAPLRQLADEVADWASSYFPISFNPPPSLARGPHAITRADLAAALEAALAASPFLAPGVLPLLVEKLSSTYRPAKEDALSALRRCCPAYGPDVLAQHIGQLWPALRSEVLAPCGHGGTAAATTAAAAAAALPAASPGGEAAACPASLPQAAAGVLKVVVCAAGPGAMDVVALQDGAMSDLLSVVRAATAAGSLLTRGSSAQAGVARADRQVLCVSMLLAAVCAAGPSSLQRAYDGPLGELRRMLAETLAGADAYDNYEQTMYGMTALTAVVDAVAPELAASPSWLGRGGGSGVTALAEVKAALTAALTVVHRRLHAAADAGAGAQQQGVGDVAMDPAPLPGDDGDGNGDGSAAAAAVPLQPGPGSDCYSQPAAAELRLAVIAAWRALLRLHQAAAAAAAAGVDAAPGPAMAAAETAQGLELTGAELADAVEQLCACAVRQDAEHPSHACRMRWGNATDVAQEAAVALQLLLQLQPAAPAQPPDGAAATAAATTDIVALLVGRLVAAMAPAEDGDGAASGRRAVALRLAVQLAQVQESLGATAAATSGNGATGPLAFAAALLESLPALLLGLKGAPGDEEWLKDCLHQLTRKVLPPLAPPLRPGMQPCAAAATAAAAHCMTAAALAAAAEWDAAGAAAVSRLPFGVPTTLEPPSLSYSASAPLTEATLTEAWCTAIQQLVLCCDDRQQLDLAMEAAERVAAYSSSLALPLTLGGPLGTSTRGSTTSSGLNPMPLASLPLACAAVAGLRPHVLAPHSTQALADSLLRLVASTAAAAGTAATATGAAVLTRPGVDGGGGGNGDCAGHPPEHHASCAAAAAVALAAAVNRWQDAAALDAWLASAFRPALLMAIGLSQGCSGGAAASMSAVQAVGWVGRALALRNHPALGEVVETLLTRALGGPPPDQAAANAAAAGGGGGTAASLAMEVDGPTEVPGLAEDMGPQGQAAEDMGPQGQAALAASRALGLLVAETAAAGGVALAARPARAVCRVLWQQRAYTICAQALDARSRTLHPRAPLPLPLAVAVASLVEASPRTLCRNDAARLAPLVLRTAQALSSALTGGPLQTAAPGRAPDATAEAEGAAVRAGPGDSGDAAATAAMALGALRGVLVMVLDWLQQQKAQPSTQLEKVLQDYATELVDCVCTAAGVGTTPRASGPGGCQQQLLRAPVAAAAAVAVREEALRCCTAILDAVPYHVLHPVRQQVMACILSALDDNKRSVRQLAVRARRVWGDK